MSSLVTFAVPLTTFDDGAAVEMAVLMRPTGAAVGVVVICDDIAVRLIASSSEDRHEDGFMVTNG